MTQATNSFSLPFLYPNQAQKDVSVNAALATIDAMLQPAVLSRTLTLAPTLPGDQDKYIVAAGATGVWAGHDNAVAVYQSVWTFYPPKPGWVVFSVADGVLLEYNGADWVAIAYTSSNTGLLDISALVPTNNAMIVGNGSHWVATNANTKIDTRAMVQALIFG